MLTEVLRLRAIHLIPEVRRIRIDSQTKHLEEQTSPFLDSHERRSMLGAVRRTLGFLFAFTISVTVLVGSSRVLAWLPVRQASGCCTGECAKKQAPQRAAKQDQPSTCSACCAGIAALFPLWQTEKFIDVRSSEHRWVTAQLSAPSREEKPPLPPPRV